MAVVEKKPISEVIVNVLKSPYFVTGVILLIIGTLLTVLLYSVNPFICLIISPIFNGLAITMFVYTARTLTITYRRRNRYWRVM